MITKNLKYLELVAKDFPTADSGKSALEIIRLGNPFDLFFFERLEDSNWLPILKASGLFSKLPVGKVGDDGTTFYPRSVALRGLLNLSKFVPVKVIEILEELEFPENPAIKDQLMGILAEIDESAITDRVLKVASRITRTQPYVNNAWIEVVLEKSVRNKCFDDTLEVINSLLDVTLAPTELHNRSVDTWQIGEIDRNIITSVSEAKPIRTAQVIFSALLKWAGNERSRERATSNRFLASRSELNEEDTPSCYWLEDFHGSVIGSHELEATLAYRLFNIGSQVLRNENLDEFEEFDSLLRSNPWNLFSRLRWQLYADHPKQTLKQARNDILARISRLSCVDATHGYEMAQMLEKHSEMHRDLFLKPDEVQTLCERVQSGPLNDEGHLVNESAYQEKFLLKQLYPIRCLLEGKDLELFNRLRETAPKIRLDAFKPFSSGGAKMIESVPPKRALEMPAMSDIELWDFLNNWVPNPKRPDPEKWWLEEDLNALGVKFAELLESTPARFPASAEWWKNLTRPSVLVKPLDRAATRIADATKNGTETSATPTENDWRNWFGVASWITSQRTVSPVDKEDIEGGVLPEDHDWNWPRIVVVKFLTAALGSKFDFPTDLVAECGRLIRKLVEDPDERLGEKDKPWMDDWVTAAINSVRGTAVEGLFELARFHKRRSGNPDPEGWIFDLILSRLKLPNESQAVFAIFGCRLRLLLHFFGEKFKSQPELLLPSDRKEHRNALLLSHFRFDNPNELVIKTLPMLADAGIECLAEMIRLDQDDKQTRGDFGSRLGTHLGFYYWNKSFSNEEIADAILDRYFATAKPSQRGSFIRQIARIFSESPDKENLHPLHEMLRKLWDRRFAKIKQELAAKSIDPQDVHSELSAFIDWLGIEGLPFDWRHDQILRAIKLLQKAPVAGFTIKTLEKISSQPERLHATLEILNELMSKDSQELRWNYQAEYLKPILLRGINSENAATKKLTEEAREILLRQGQFEYLDLGSE